MGVALATSAVYHTKQVSPYCSVKTELMEDGANSTLSIAKIHKADSGNYTCSISEYQNFTIVVHILNGNLSALARFIQYIIKFLLSPLQAKASRSCIMVPRGKGHMPHGSILLDCTSCCCCVG